MFKDANKQKVIRVLKKNVSGLSFSLRVEVQMGLHMFVKCPLWVSHFWH